ncbi:MAG: hypothetical protein QOJ37_644 [Pseudonocardiales bacterium]|nr:hypothetical protein [Pseudonocardiales bacterium]
MFRTRLQKATSTRLDPDAQFASYLRTITQGRIVRTKSDKSCREV